MPDLPLAVLLPWGLLALALIVDAVASLRRQMPLQLDMPDEIFVGETVTMSLTVPDAPEGLVARMDWDVGITAPAEAAFLRQADGTALATADLRAVQRGTWALRQIWLLWPSRFGLWDCAPRLRPDLSVRVVPNIRLVQSGAITSSVQSALYGVKENQSFGEGSEFHQLRDFVPGMDVKSIDWKRSARKRALVAKDMHAERNHHVILCLDTGYLMRQEVAGLARLDHAVTAALATAWAAAIGGDRVGYFAYDAAPHHFEEPGPGRRNFARMRSWSAQLSTQGRETNHTLAMSMLNARTPKRSLIVVFTDFVDTTSAELLLDNLAVLARRHLIVFVSIRDPDLDQLTATPPEDLDGAATLVAAYQSLMDRKLVIERLTRLGITVVDAAPGTVTARLVSAYLDIKARELI